MCCKSQNGWFITISFLCSHFARRMIFNLCYSFAWHKIIKKSTFCNFFYLKNIKLCIFRFGNNVKHNANHINQPKITELGSNKHFWRSFDSLPFLFICFVYTLTLLKQLFTSKLGSTWWGQFCIQKKFGDIGFSWGGHFLGNHSSWPVSCYSTKQ